MEFILFFFVYNFLFQQFSSESVHERDTFYLPYNVLSVYIKLRLQSVCLKRLSFSSQYSKKKKEYISLFFFDSGNLNDFMMILRIQKFHQDISWYVT